ncbi:helix-turn-helix domain-containing protein [Thiocystis violacea]|uniref:helix-turn-helix domain-containing protein n=1 Tax=Thiocystis violacea TaxID=13725 RepID=UPI00190892A2|nr:XRE family transcriptional regulator [Thiocystis violacea]
MKNLQDIMNALPPERRAQVEARADAMIAEEMTLRDLRKAHDLTQARMAELLGVGQESISRLEGRADMLLSTLRSYITAMGGSLDLVVRFPDRPAVSLSALFEPQTGNKETTRRTQ